MSDGYGADPEVLKQAAKGTNQTIEELQGVGMVGGGAVGRGFGSLQLTQLQVGHTGLPKAFATFAERWEWGVKALVDEGNEIAGADDLQVRLTGGVDDYPEQANGPVQYVVVANMEGILGALYASDVEGAVGYVVRPELGHEASNCSSFWIGLMRSARARGLAPTRALAEMVAQGGYPFPGRALPGPWLEAPSRAALKDEIVGDGKWDLRPRDLKIHVYPVIPLRGPKMLPPPR